ncbi:MAG TPA: FecR family protein [Candidatus Nitrosotenuis sp.]|nr:FecR family protein [Candidatus Nitrosotenuis sp.]
MKKIRGFALLAAALLALAAPALAASGAWKVVVRVKGQVQSQVAGAVSWVNIITSRMLQDGDRARTQPESLAQIRLADGTVLMMGPSTTVTMEQVTLAATRRTAQVQVASGSVRTRTSTFMGSSQVKVRTPNAVMAARGTDFFVNYTPSGSQSAAAGLWAALPGPVTDGGLAQEEGGGTTRVAVFEGRVTITDSQGNSQDLTGGQTADVTDQGIEVNPADFTLPDVAQVGGDPIMGEELDDIEGPEVETSTDMQADLGDTGVLTGGTFDALDSAPPVINPQAETTGGIVITISP